MNMNMSTKVLTYILSLGMQRGQEQDLMPLYCWTLTTPDFFLLLIRFFDKDNMDFFSQRQHMPRACCDNISTFQRIFFDFFFTTSAPFTFSDKDNKLQQATTFFLLVLDYLLYDTRDYFYTGFLSFLRVYWGRGGQPWAQAREVEG